MPLTADSAICLRLTPYSETSQIVTLLTRRHGTLRLLAKGAHRKTKAGSSKFDGGLDLLDRGEAVFSAAAEKDLGLLTEWKLVDGHLPLRRSLRGMVLGQYLAEVTSLTIHEHDAHPALYARLVATLRQLGTIALEEAQVAYILDLLRECGVQPELLQCTSCGRRIDDRTDRIFFSPARGGVVCRDCEAVVPDRMELDVRLLRIVVGIVRLPRVEGVAQRLPRLTRAQTDPINRLLADHLEHVVQRPLHTKPFVVPPRGRVAASPATRAPAAAPR